ELFGDDLPQLGQSPGRRVRPAVGLWPNAAEQVQARRAQGQGNSVRLVHLQKLGGPGKLGVGGGQKFVGAIIKKSRGAPKPPPHRREPAGYTRTDQQLLPEERCHKLSLRNGSRPAGRSIEKTPQRCNGDPRDRCSVFSVRCSGISSNGAAYVSRLLEPFH